MSSHRENLIHPPQSAIRLGAFRALLVSAPSIIFAVPALFYFRALETSLPFLFFTLFVSLPLCFSTLLLARTASIDYVNRHYSKLLWFYILGSAYQLYALGIRAPQLLDFKAGLDTFVEGSAFKIPVLAGFIGWAKYGLICTKAKNKGTAYLAYAFIVLFEVVANFKRSALIFLGIPILLRVLLDSRRSRTFYLGLAALLVSFAVMGDFREGGIDVAAPLEPLTDSPTLNWLFTYASVPYHVAYQKYVAEGQFDLPCLLRTILATECATGFSIHGFNATTYVGNFVELGLLGVFLIQLVMVTFALMIRVLSPISRGLFLYLVTLYTLNLFGAYILERNEFMLAIGWVLYEVTRRRSS